MCVRAQRSFGGRRAQAADARRSCEKPREGAASYPRAHEEHEAPWLARRSRCAAREATKYPRKGWREREGLLCGKRIEQPCVRVYGVESTLLCEGEESRERVSVGREAGQLRRVRGYTRPPVRALQKISCSLFVEAWSMVERCRQCVVKLSLAQAAAPPATGAPPSIPGAQGAAPAPRGQPRPPFRFCHGLGGWGSGAWPLRPLALAPLPQLALPCPPPPAAHATAAVLRRIPTYKTAL